MSALETMRRAAQRAAGAEVWAAAGLAAGCVATERLLLPAVVVLAMFWPLRLLARGRLSVRTPLDWAAAGLALLLPVTLLASPLRGITLTQVYRLLVGMGLCYAIANHAWSAAGLRGVMAGLAGLGAGLGLAALVSVHWNLDKLTLIPVGALQSLPRLLGEQVHPNVMAGALALLALFAPGWLLFGGRQLRWGGRMLLLLAAAFTLGVLALTKSRGAWLGLAAGLGVLAMLRWPRWGAAAILAIGLAGGVWAAVNPGVAQKLLAGVEGYNAVSTFSGREVIWTRAAAQIEDFPLTGMGMGTFPEVTRALYPTFMLAAGDVPHAHNLYLQIAVDLGLPGLAVWLGMAWGALRCAWQVYRAGRRHIGWPAGLGAGLLAAQAAMAVHGLVDAVTWGTRPAPLVWGLWGVAVGAALLLAPRRKGELPILLKGAGG